MHGLNLFRVSKEAIEEFRKLQYTWLSNGGTPPVVLSITGPRETLPQHASTDGIIVLTRWWRSGDVLYCTTGVTSLFYGAIVI